MNWITVAGAILAALGLAFFYYRMILAKNSPQRLLGKDFTMPDVRLRYTPDTLYQTFADAGEGGRPQLRRYWLYDFGLMLCLTVVMLAVTANIAAPGTWIYAVMLSLSVVRTLVDVAEDWLFLSLLKRYPAKQPGTARLAGVVTTGKHALLFAWVALLFFLLIVSAFAISK